VEEQNNVYEWAHGQIFRLVSAGEGAQAIAISGEYAAFGGASADGSDVYVVTPESLTWEDGDQRLSAYDARIRGGNPEPPPPAVPCDAAAENSCQTPSQSVPETAGAATTADSGAQNFEAQKKSPAKKKSNKGKKKKKAKKGKKGSKKRKGKAGRKANGNRRAGK
jgi:hypothetical protein